MVQIVSGGQTGVDQGALEACQWCGFPYGGWVPNGRKTENGKLPPHFQGMKEHPSTDYLARTEANVVDSDATAVLTFGKPSGGSLRTIKFAKKHKRPWFHADLHLPMDKVVSSFIKWLNEECPPKCVLNVAGTRESKHPGIQKTVFVWMIDIIGKDTGKCFYPPPMQQKPKNFI